MARTLEHVMPTFPKPNNKTTTKLSNRQQKHMNQVVVQHQLKGGSNQKIHSKKSRMKFRECLRSLNDKYERRSKMKREKFDYVQADPTASLMNTL